MTVFVYSLFGIAVFNLILFILFITTRAYPTIFVFLHIFSLTILWIGVLYKIIIKKNVTFEKKDILLLILLFFTALAIRMYQIDTVTPGLYGDELTVAVQSLALLHRADMPPFLGEYSHPTPLLYMNGLLMQVMGHTVLGIRFSSVLFGALDVGAFYFLLRLFFIKKIALLGAVLFLFQYSHIVLSRLAYEPTASLFFQIMTVSVFILYAKSKELFYLLLLALFVGAGFYTYLNFRTFACIIMPLIFFAVLRNSWRSHIAEAGLFFITFCIAVMPLISYVVIDTQGFLGRTSELSIFSQHYTSSKVAQELGGNMWRTVTLPYIGFTGHTIPMSGDPNPGKNPSGVPIFDPLTTCLALLGSIYLFRKKRWVFWGVVLFSLPPLISDIFSIEKIPEFHYLGLGHPNLLRVSGMLPIILFMTTYGLLEVYTWVKKYNTQVAVGVIIGIIFIITFVNIHWYFYQQQINRKLYIYNYKVNHADTLQMIAYLNNTSAQTISVSQKIADQKDYLHFFLKPSVQTSTFGVLSADSTMNIIRKNDATAIAVDASSINIINEILSADQYEKMGYSMHEIQGIVAQPDIIIFERARNK